MKKRSARLHSYLVTYNIHRIESYRVDAISAEDAQERAYVDGEFVNIGDTFDVVPFECEWERVLPPKRERDRLQIEEYIATNVRPEAP